MMSWDPKAMAESMADFEAIYEETRFGKMTSTPEGKAEVMKYARELRAAAREHVPSMDCWCKPRIEHYEGSSIEAQRTTVAVTREDVDAALAYLGIENPIPGHFAFPDRLERSLVGIADTLKRIEARIPKRGDIVA